MVFREGGPGGEFYTVRGLCSLNVLPEPTEGGMGLPHQFARMWVRREGGETGLEHCQQSQKKWSQTITEAECLCVCLYRVLALGTQLSSGWLSFVLSLSFAFAMNSPSFLSLIQFAIVSSLFLPVSDLHFRKPRAFSPPFLSSTLRCLLHLILLFHQVIFLALVPLNLFWY